MTPTLQQIVDYLRKYKDQYPLEAMKQHLCKQGISEAEVEEAVRIATGAEWGCPVPKPGQDDKQEYDAQEYAARKQQNLVKLLFKVPLGCLAVFVALVFASYVVGLSVDNLAC